MEEFGSGRFKLKVSSTIFQCKPLGGTRGSKKCTRHDSLSIQPDCAKRLKRLRDPTRLKEEVWLTYID